MVELVHRETSSHHALPLFGGFRRAVERIRAHRELRAARRGADREILLSATPSLRHSWRAAELATPKNRFALANSLRDVVRDAEIRHVPSASPVNFAAVREQSNRLRALGDRLADLERPVAARGVLLTEHLLTDGTGPLYDHSRTDALPFYVDAALEALEPR